MKKNLKYSENDFSNRLVAFVDILGFKKLIQQENDKCVNLINFIDEQIDHVLDFLKEFYGTLFSTKLFSDCICVSCPNTPENTIYLLYELSFLQWHLSCGGIFIRGAISQGNHFESDRIIFSQGLVNAYELEKLAIYPRIVIDKNLAEQMLQDQDSYSPSYTGFKKSDFIIESPDGQFFLDYLSFLYEEAIDQIEFLHSHKQVLLNNISENSNSTKILQKCLWLAEYHNYKCNEFIDWSQHEEENRNEFSEEILINIPDFFPKFKKVEGNAVQS